MPVTRLMGQSPAGLNATGESDLRIFNDTVQAEQERVVRPALERLTEIVMSDPAGPTDGQIPEEWSIEFNALQQLSELEMTDMRLKQAQADNIYLQQQVVTPEEIGRSRFPVSGWSPETSIDLELREDPGALAELTEPEPIE